jgi:ELWxxDGT repeat protein
MKTNYFTLFFIFCIAFSFGQIVELKNINPGTASSSPNTFFNYNGTLIFRANDGVNGAELWKSDGTATGTVLVKDIATGASNGDPGAFTVLGTDLIFNGNSGSTATGQELWKSDGTGAGTIVLKDIYAGTSSSNPQNFIKINTTTLLFSANDGINGIELWKTNGTNAGTSLVKDYPGTSNSITWAQELNGLGIFGQNINGVTARELYISDGTTTGSNLLVDINSGTGIGVGTVSFKAGNIIYFQGNNGATGFELWKTDGTAAGTVLVKDIYPGATGSSVSNFATLNGVVYFRATTLTNGNELWKTDGTTAGTIEVADINPGTGSAVPSEIFTFNGAIYFFAADNGTNYDFYKYDGITLTKLYDFNATIVTTSYALVNNKLYFGVDSNADNLRELWTTDGTATGTVAVASLFTPVVNPTSVNNIIAVNNKIFFSAALNNGNELFFFDPLTLSTTAFNNQRIAVYPNPTKNILNVSHNFSADVNYTIFDISGKKVTSGTVANNQIFFDGNNGIYFLQLQSDQFVHNTKFIKQ